MNCPSCGTAYGAGAEECPACGVIFARYRERVDRMIRPAAVAYVPEHEDESSIPLWVVLTAVVLIGIAGVAWTVHRRRARESYDAKAEFNRRLNEINAKGNETRDRLQRERDRLYASEARQTQAATVRASSRPADLTDDAIARILETCPYFRDTSSARLPKSFRRDDYAYTLKQYPALFAAARDGFVEFRPPLPSIFPSSDATLPNPTVYSEPVSVVLTSSGSLNLRTTESGGDYVVDLGSRRLDKVTAISATDNVVSLGFSWRYSEDAASTLAPELETRTGGANIEKVAGTWTLQSVWMGNTSVCGN